MSIIESLIGAHPVRKTRAQKEAFRAWALEQAQAMGWDGHEEKSTTAANLVFGDPEKAEVTFTAHYDTPPVMFFPNLITPRSIGLYLLYQLVIVVVMLGGGILLGVAMALLTGNVQLGIVVAEVLYFATLGLLIFGPANKNNVNDNSSGVASVLEIMKRLPEEAREKTAFILFDNEEKGLVGSAAYAKAHTTVKKEKLLINMDCVGDGENVLFFVNKRTRALPVYEVLKQSLEAQQGRTLLMNDMEKCIYPSDQANYRFGIAVCACNRHKVFGYYCDKIHTKHDTVCDQANLDFIADGLVDFASRL